MRMNPRRLFGAATLLVVTTGGLLLGGTASATPTPVEPDPRAVIVEGNLEWDHPNVCATAGLTGTAMDGDLPDGSTKTTLPHTADGLRSITITGGLEGYTVTGVVVKGSNDSNVYTAEKLGELNWEKLVAPNNSSGAPADISHWFFCVEKDDSVTTTPSTPVTTTTPSTPVTTTTTDAPGVTTTTAPSTTAPVTTTEAPATTTTTEAGAVAGPGDDELASTGFNGGWMLIVGLALVAAGAAFVASPKLRGLLRR
ncbi:septal ring-binding cell division protein DamX [Saccharothrix ecbatanensis]|uniref:Septal ring-binding cell division protein DamX n=1 Tax=Saccharothrix ecbatanensis TaxID=1105145 RepID=A0A7W9HT78_9PSEU|nr:hypothetical protein [Saccharothrix ecbatanensis]MBB5808027.1 septal ring-binding cell division protein DamX [Saccharothrix ecbatanensis]